MITGWSPPVAFDVVGVSRRLRRNWPTLGLVEPFGPCGVQWLIMRGRIGIGSIIVTQAEHEGAEWIHASIAYMDRLPIYDELAELHRAVFGRRRYAFQVFAPESDHVNIHANALHLWGRADGSSPLPEFGALGTI